MHWTRCALRRALRCRCALVPLAAAALVASSGCASIMSKSRYDVTIDTNPSGRTIRVTDRDGGVVHSGPTPVTLKLRSSAGYFRTAEYEIEVVEGERAIARRRLEAGLDGWYFGNILFGWFIGFLFIDPVTGAMWSLEDEVMIRVEGELP